MDLRGQLTVLRRHLLAIVLGTVVAAMAALGVSSVLPKVYQAQATLLVGQSLSAVNPDINQLLASQQVAQTDAQIATARPLLQKVIDQLGLGVTPEELAKQVSADAPQNSSLIHITASDGKADRAAAVANALATQLVAESPAIQGRQGSIYKSIDDNLRSTQQEIDTTQAEVQALVGVANRTQAQQQQLDLLQARLITLRQTYATLLGFSSNAAPNLLSVIEPAVTPPSPASPRPLLYTGLAAVLGLLLMVALAFGRNALDDTLHTPEDVEATLGLPTLAQIGQLKAPKYGGEGHLLVSAQAPHSAVAEAFRTLRTNIDFASVDAPIRSLLVTSSSSGEGKTVLAANLAVMFAQGGRKTLLIDADLRRPGAHRLFGLSNSMGLTSLLRDDDLPLEGVIRPSEQPLLRVLTTGPLPPNPAELLNSQRMERTMARLRREADILIVDSPPLQVTDAAILASRLDGTLLVVQAAKARRGAIRRGREVLANAGANVLGVALNQVPGEDNVGSVGYYGEWPGQGAVASDSASVVKRALPPVSTTAPAPTRKLTSQAAASSRKNRT